MKITRFAVIAACLALLAACGLKGNLKLPETQKQEQEKQQAAPQTAPEAH